MYQILPHTADIRIKVEAADLPALFASAMSGISQILKPEFCEQRAVFENVKHISVTALDSTALLIDFLSDVLTLSYEDKAVFCKAEFIKLEPGVLEAKLYGASVEGFDEDIKAVTYHEAQVVKNKQGNFETVIVLDI